MTDFGTLPGPIAFLCDAVGGGILIWVFTFLIAFTYLFISERAEIRKLNKYRYETERYDYK